MKNIGLFCPRCGQDSWFIEESSSMRPQDMQAAVTCAACGDQDDKEQHGESVQEALEEWCMYVIEKSLDLSSP